MMGLGFFELLILAVIGVMGLMCVAGVFLLIRAAAGNNRRDSDTRP